MDNSKPKKKKNVNVSQHNTSNRIDIHYGSRYISDHIDAEIEFYWHVKANIEVPKNKVLTGIAQFVQKTVTRNLFIGTLVRGHFQNFSNINFHEICNRSLNEIIIMDQFGNGYTGRQFIDIVNASI